MWREEQAHLNSARLLPLLDQHKMPHTPRLGRQRVRVKGVGEIKLQTDVELPTSSLYAAIGLVTMDHDGSIDLRGAFLSVKTQRQCRRPVHPVAAGSARVRCWTTRHDPGAVPARDVCSV